MTITTAISVGKIYQDDCDLKIFTALGMVKLVYPEPASESDHNFIGSKHMMKHEF